MPDTDVPSISEVESLVLPTNDIIHPAGIIICPITSTDNEIISTNEVPIL